MTFRNRMTGGIVKFTTLALPPFIVAEVILRLVLGFGDIEEGNVGLTDAGLPAWPEMRSISIGGEGEEPRTTYNRFGFRGEEWDVERVPGRRRIVMAGDSFGFGYGLSDDETLAAKLEGRLSDTEVYNLSIPGLNTQQEAALLEQWVPKLKPDIVLLVVIQNDTEAAHCNRPISPGCLEANTLSEKTYWWLLTHMYLFRALNFVFAENACRGPQACPASLMEGTPQHGCFVASLRKVAKVARAQKARALVVFYPDLSYDWLPNQAEALGMTFGQELAPILAAEHLDYLNLTGPFDLHGGRKLKIKVQEDDQHPSGYANDLTAQLVIEKLSGP